MNEQDAKQKYGAYFITAEELAARLDGKQAMPDELRTDAHLICNTPAAIDFNSPGAQGFGVKRAGSASPTSPSTRRTSSRAATCKRSRRLSAPLSPAGRSAPLSS